MIAQSGDLKYRINKSRRAKNICLSVKSDASVLLTIPWWVPVGIGKSFFNKKIDWVLTQVEQRKKDLKDVRLLTRSDYLDNKEKARNKVLAKLAHFNKVYNFQYNKIFIKDQKTRWGSCSSLGNLNFNYKIVFLTDEQVNYIVVHELCHLRQMNHSRLFWQLVEKTIPNHREIRRQLKAKTLKLI